MRNSFLKLVSCVNQINVFEVGDFPDGDGKGTTFSRRCYAWSRASSAALNAFVFQDAFSHWAA
jgi:hypothetical protein